MSNLRWLRLDNAKLKKLPDELSNLGKLVRSTSHFLKKHLRRESFIKLFSLRKLKVFTLQILQRYLTKEGRVQKVSAI